MSSTELFDEVVRRAYFAIYKAVSDGLPALAKPGLTDAGRPSMKEWCGSENVTKLLSERDAQAAADLAHWIADAAIDMAAHIMKLDAERNQIFSNNAAHEVLRVLKYTKFKKVPGGRQKGTKKVIENAEKSREKWAPFIAQERKDHPTFGRRRIYDLIERKHKKALEPYWRSYHTVMDWIPARK